MGVGRSQPTEERKEDSGERKVSTPSWQQGEGQAVPTGGQTLRQGFLRAKHYSDY